MDTWALWQKAGRVDPISARWYLDRIPQALLRCPRPAWCSRWWEFPWAYRRRKSGKSGGFVLTILLVFVYYVISLIGVSLARQGTRLALVRSVAGRFYLSGPGGFSCCCAPRSVPLSWPRSGRIWKRDASGSQPAIARGRRENAFERASTRRRMFSASFPTLLDDYVLRDFFVYLGMILSTFLVLVIVFTLFELLGDILRNQVPATVVAEYLLNVAPYLLYNVAPLVMLLAVLVTFGVMQRSNEITAIKAAGTSIYRIVTPVIAAAAVLAAGLFFADQFYLPHTNKRQEALHNQIKGKPPQTYLRPDRKWIFGQHNDIYYYQFFDPDRDQFGNVTVFQLDRASFTITRRIHADRAHWAENLNRWIYEQGWDRSLNVSAIANYPALRSGHVSRPAGNAVVFQERSQAVQRDELPGTAPLHPRFATERIRRGALARATAQKALLPPDHADHGCTCDSVLACQPDKKGAITGVAVAVGIAVFYTVVSRLFEAMGDLSQLPPALAAWSPDLIFILVGGYLILKVPT